jgi:hypothetical protein
MQNFLTALSAAVGYSLTNDRWCKKLIRRVFSRVFFVLGNSF